MKRLKNYQRTVVGIEHKYFTILINQNKKTYNYWVNTFPIVRDWIGRDLIKVRTLKEKSKLLNKYTLNILYFIMNIGTLIFIPLVIISYPFITYYVGARSFIYDKFDKTDERFFNWANILIIIVMIATYFLGYI